MEAFKSSARRVEGLEVSNLDQPCKRCGHLIRRHKGRLTEWAEGVGVAVMTLRCADCDCSFSESVEAEPTDPDNDQPKELPEWFFSMESTRPDEPLTAGMDVGPGPGSEILKETPPVEGDTEEPRE